MPKAKFLKFFAVVEMLTAIIFISLAVIFYMSKDILGGSITIPVIFAVIGIFALIAAPVFLSYAKKQESS